MERNGKGNGIWECYGKWKGKLKKVYVKGKGKWEGKEKEKNSGVHCVNKGMRGWEECSDRECQRN